MKKRQPPVIFVIGFMGSDRKGLSETVAEKMGYKKIDLDEEIEREDGRSILRICMMMGEHEYRNKEYAMLRKCVRMEGIVCSCGDGVVLDDSNRELLKKHKVLVADAELDPEKLWDRAKDEKNLPYAFMQQTETSLKKETFIALYEQRKPLYNLFIEEA